jgi:hypothetical protein
VRRAWTQDGGDELVGLAVEDQQGVIHVLAVVAMVAAAFLRAVGRIVSAVEIQQHLAGRTARHPLALLQIDADQRLRQALAGAAVDRVLQA